MLVTSFKFQNKKWATLWPYTLHGPEKTCGTENYTCGVCDGAWVDIHSVFLISANFTPYWMSRSDWNIDQMLKIRNWMVFYNKHITDFFIWSKLLCKGGENLISFSSWTNKSIRVEQCIISQSLFDWIWRQLAATFVFYFLKSISSP